ncbi:MAG: hypothetical protein U0805_01935 [Pirellulales bacterium]
MNDVIRNAIISLKILLEEPDLRSPAIDEAAKSQEALAEATAKQTSAATMAEAANAKQAAAAESLATATAGTTAAVDATTVAIEAESVAAEASAAANTVAAGGFLSLEAAVGNIAGIMALALIGINMVRDAYDYLTESAEEAAEAQRKLNEENQKGIDALNKLASLEMKRIDLIKDASEKERALRQVMKDPIDSPEYIEKSKVPAAQELLRMYEKRHQAAERERKAQIDTVNLRDRELKSASERLEAAKLAIRKAEAFDRDQEYRRTHDAKGRPRKGASSYESEVSQMLAAQRADTLRQANEMYTKALAKFNETTGGKSAAEAIASINSAEDEIVKGIDQLSEGVTVKLREFYDRLSAVEFQAEQQRQGEAAKRAPRLR